MIDTTDPTKKNQDERLQTIQQIPETKKPTFKTEITVAVNAPNEINDDNEDLVILRHDNRVIVNRSAYSKLHKRPKSSENRFSSLSLGKYDIFKRGENEKYSSRKTTDSRVTSPKTKSFNELLYTQNHESAKNSDDESNFVPCVIRKSESVDTVDKIEQELSNFIIMDKKKDKKRTNSFRKLFSVSLFSKDKKKKEKDTSVIHSTNSDCVDNYQNEANCNAFLRSTPERHTVSFDHQKRPNFGPKFNDTPKNIEEDPPPEIMRQYASIHINKFNKIRQSFENPNDNSFCNIPSENTVENIPASHITKYIDTSSSSSTLESQKRNTYENAMIAQAELQQAVRDNGFIPSKLNRSDSLRRETPPRAQDTYQRVNIVKPKARLPINSGRPLPNPYQHDEESTTDKNSYPANENELKENPQLNEIYGTVLDAIPYTKCRETSHEKPSNPELLRASPSPILHSPRSPSLEISKLKLPPNREITPLQPRIRSPLPSSKVSTEKIIATELLKNTNQGFDETKKNSTSTHTPQDSIPQTKSTVVDALNALRTKLEANDQNLKQELDQIRSTLQNLTHNDDTQRITTPNTLNKEVLYNTNSPRGTLLASSRSSITMSPLPQIVTSGDVSCSPNTRNSSLPSPDVELRQKHSPRRMLAPQNLSHSPSSPSKDEIRRSVEAYYWKEIKKIKEREDYEIYLSQLHYSQEGFAEDPICSRRSRGMEDIRGRRSSSVPRSARHLSFDNTNDSKSFVIPEGRTLVYDPYGRGIYGYLPAKNVHITDSSRNTIESSTSSTKRENGGDYGTYKPIFRRGSLSGNINQPIQTNKRVSFSNSRQPENSAAWPTKNGFTKSPPQRRLEKAVNSNLEDDVFLPQFVPQPIYGYQQAAPARINYNSDTESIYGRNMGYRGQMPLVRSANYNSDSEAVYGRQRRYKTLTLQEMENLRNSQTKELRQAEVKQKPLPRLTRHESIQLPEPMYGYAMQYRADPRGSYRSISRERGECIPGQQNRMARPPIRRDIVITDDIYGQHIGYQESPYGYSMNNPTIAEPLYVSRSKQVTVRNKVCDMYGRIHDMDSVRGEVQQTGVLVGTLQSSPSSPMNFRRGTRLTASNNDILQRRRPGDYQGYKMDSSIAQPNARLQEDIPKGAPVRPLPPLPPSGKTVQTENSKSSKKNNSRKKKK
ncbi:hypothetical protein HHI36_006130 [Cryptolaemus montrouzieri]|uniref:Uncharacterized protein n=1 Tax=Cryptolaemus montrouzieri TaxID=559131 RepID=A0ABD2NX49_9CUCU